MIKIRNFVSEDFNQILQLGKNFVLTPYMIDPEFRKHSVICEPLLIAAHKNTKDINILVAEENSKILGFISYTQEKLLADHFPQISKCGSILFLAVDPLHQNKKIGTTLLEKCLEESYTKRILILRIGVDNGNFIAQKLYRKYQFKNILDFDIYRIYKKSLVSISDFTDIPILDSFYPDDLICKAIKKRPLHWLHEKKIPRDELVSILNIKNKMLINKKTQNLIVSEDIQKNPLGFFLRQDILRKKHYRLAGTIWHISDLFNVNQSTTNTSCLIQKTLLSLPHFLMAEYSVTRTDISTKTVLQNAGMKLVYQGESLGYHF